MDELKARIKEQGIEAKPKEVYNAVGYLAKRGHIRRVGYGRYIVDGIEVVTADDLGGAPSRHEDGYKI
jgi:predicted transcriptional regulator of viral defense system